MVRVSLVAKQHETKRNRQIFDNASDGLYEALHGLMSSLLCDPATSPFLLEINAAACLSRPSSLPRRVADGGGGGKRSQADGRDGAVVTGPRVLLAGLACLGAHEDLGQRALLLVGIVARFFVFYLCFICRKVL